MLIISIAKLLPKMIKLKHGKQILYIYIYPHDVLVCCIYIYSCITTNWKCFWRKTRRKTHNLHPTIVCIWDTEKHNNSKITLSRDQCKTEEITCVLLLTLSRQSLACKALYYILCSDRVDILARFGLHVFFVSEDNVHFSGNFFHFQCTRIR